MDQTKQILQLLSSEDKENLLVSCTCTDSPLPDEADANLSFANIVKKTMDVKNKRLQCCLDILETTTTTCAKLLNCHLVSSEEKERVEEDKRNKEVMIHTLEERELKLQLDKENSDKYIDLQRTTIDNLNEEIKNKKKEIELLQASQKSLEIEHISEIKGLKEAINEKEKDMVALKSTLEEMKGQKRILDCLKERNNSLEEELAALHQEMRDHASECHERNLSSLKGDEESFLCQKDLAHGVGKKIDAVVKMARVWKNKFIELESLLRNLNKNVTSRLRLPADVLTQNVQKISESMNSSIDLLQKLNDQCEIVLEKFESLLSKEGLTKKIMHQLSSQKTEKEKLDVIMSFLVDADKKFNSAQENFHLLSIGLNEHNDELNKEMLAGLQRGSKKVGSKCFQESLKSMLELLETIRRVLSKHRNEYQCLLTSVWEDAEGNKVFPSGVGEISRMSTSSEDIKTSELIKTLQDKNCTLNSKINMLLANARRMEEEKINIEKEKTFEIAALKKELDSTKKKLEEVFGNLTRANEDKSNNEQLLAVKTNEIQELKEKLPGKWSSGESKNEQNEEIEKLKEEIKDLKEEVQLRTQERDEVVVLSREDLKELRECKTARDLYKKRLNFKISEYKELEEKLKTFTECTKNEEENKSQVREIQKLKEEIRKLTEEIEQRTRDHTKLVAESAEYKAERDRFKKQLISQPNEVKEMKEKLSLSSSVRINHEPEERKNEQNEEIEKLKEEIKDLKEEIELRTQERNELAVLSREDLKELRECRTERDLYKKRLNFRMSENKELEEKLKNLAKLTKGSGESNLELDEDKKQQKEEIKKLRKEIENLKEELQLKSEQCEKMREYKMERDISKNEPVVKINRIEKLSYQVKDNDKVQLKAFPGIMKKKTVESQVQRESFKNSYMSLEDNQSSQRQNKAKEESASPPESFKKTPKTRSMSVGGHPSTSKKRVFICSPKNTRSQSDLSPEGNENLNKSKRIRTRQDVSLLKGMDNTDSENLDDSNNKFLKPSTPTLRSSLRLQSKKALTDSNQKRSLRHSTKQLPASLGKESSEDEKENTDEQTCHVQ